MPSRKPASAEDFLEDPVSVLVLAATEDAARESEPVRQALLAKWPELTVHVATRMQALHERLLERSPDLLLIMPTGDAEADLKLVEQVAGAAPSVVPTLLATATGAVIRIVPDACEVGDSSSIRDCSLEDRIVHFAGRMQRRRARRSLHRFRMRWIEQSARRYRRLSMEDTLTGLLNRRGFHRIMKLAWAQASRQNTDLACVAIDIDHFKDVNDNYGHSLGDWALRCFASTLTSACRSSDVIGRIGGEEFCVLLPNCHEQQALEWAEKARARVEETELFAKGDAIRLTASFGVAAFSSDLRDEHELVDLADRALMVAKHSGRNSVVSAHAIARDKSASNRLDSCNPVIRSLLDSLSVRDRAISEHCERVSAYSARLARRLGLHANEVWTAEMAGLLHDVGKIGVPDNVLNKPGVLDPEERDLVRWSLESSYDIVRSAFGEGPLAQTVRDSRRWFRDFADSPRNQQPISGQIVAIADAYDSMTSPAPYRKSRTGEQALEELNRCAGTQFDAELVDHFSAVVAETR